MSLKRLLTFIITCVIVMTASFNINAATFQETFNKYFVDGSTPQNNNRVLVYLWAPTSFGNAEAQWMGLDTVAYKDSTTDNRGKYFIGYYLTSGKLDWATELRNPSAGITDVEDIAILLGDTEFSNEDFTADFVNVTVPNKGFDLKRTKVKAIYNVTGGMIDKDANKYIFNDQAAYHLILELDKNCIVYDGIEKETRYAKAGSEITEDEPLENTETQHFVKWSYVSKPSNSEITFTNGKRLMPIYDLLATPVFEDHDWDEGTVTTPATESSAGVMTYTCNTCQDTKTSVIPILEHDLEHHTSNEATCLDDGNIEYWVCKNSDCLKLFSDAECTTEIALEETVIASLGHSLKTTFTYDDNEHWHECNRCTDKFDEENHILNRNYECVKCDYSIIPATFDMLEGDQSKWNDDSVLNLYFRADTDYDKFMFVEVDDVLVNPTDYIKSSGSTIIELKNTYLKTLSAGSHSLTVYSTEGYSTATFTIKHIPNSPNPGYVVPNTCTK